MNAQQSPCQETTRHILALPVSGKGNGNRFAVFDSKGMHHCERHIPRASTVARFPLSLSKCSKFGVRKVNVQVNAFSKFTYADFCVFPSQPPPSSPIPRLRLRIGLVSPAQKKDACYETLFAKITGKVKHSVLTFQTISHEKKPNCQHFLLQDVPTLY